MERNWHPGEAHPYTDGEVTDPSLDNEASEAAVHEVEEPLLSSVGAMVPDVASCEGLLLVEVLLTVPGSPLLLGHTQTLAERESHVLLVSEFVMLKSTSLDVHAT